MAKQLGRTIHYPSFVNVNAIKYVGNSTYRYALTIPFAEETNNLLVVILKNPSSATAQNCDNTISKVCNVAKNNGYDGVIILNLFPIRATYATMVQNFYNSPQYAIEMKNNLNVITTTCQNRDVVFAWGTDTIGGRKKFPNHYDNAIKDVVNAVTVNTFFVKKCSCKNKHCSSPNIVNHNTIRYPAHGLTWYNNSILIKY